MSKPPIPAPNSPAKSQANGAPRWETWAMALSFVALWAWFMAYLSASRPGGSLSAWWQVPLAVSLAVLIWIFVRRMKRALAGLKEVHPAQRGRSGHN